MSGIGFYGKLPAHGDFIRADLPDSFVTPWDLWLQETLLKAQQDRPEDWLQHYLVSPPWRFALNDPALGEEVWCGVVIPSVDAVGRFFPLTIAISFTGPTTSSLLTQFNLLNTWISSVEQTALEALSEQFHVEELRTRLDQLEKPTVFEEKINSTAMRLDDGYWHWQSREKSNWDTALLSAMTSKSFEHPCLWEFVNHPESFRERIITNGFKAFKKLICLPLA